jgi:hypothetical protein
MLKIGQNQGDDMTKRGNKSKGERALETEQNMKQLQTATRVTQMLVQQIGNSVQTLSKDFGELTGRQRDAQYRVLAIQALLNLNVDEVNRKAEELQVRDFEEAATKEDLADGCTSTDLVEEDCVIVLTSKVGETGGILRTRLRVAELGFPQLKQDLLGKKVGDTVGADINGTLHSITILDIKKMPEKVEYVGQPDQPVTESAATI